LLGLLLSFPLLSTAATTSTSPTELIELDGLF